MADSQLVLGDFEFESAAIPTQIDVGGSQQLVIHELIGGIRVIDAMGRRDRALTWNGWFRGSGAKAQSDYLNAYRIGGQTLSLTWASFKYQVIVKEYRAEILLLSQIHYYIECEVVSDLTTVVPTGSAAVVNVDSALRNDQTTMNTLGNWS